MDLIRRLYDSDNAYWRWSDGITEHPVFRWGPVVLAGAMAVVTFALGNYEHTAFVVTLGLLGWYFTRD